MLLRTNGEKPEIKFIYTNKTADEVSITNTFTADPESVQILYKTTDGVVFRLIAKLNYRHYHNIGIERLELG